MTRTINTGFDPATANGTLQPKLPIEPSDQSTVRAEEAERDQLLKARESFSGRLLTDAQFDEAIAITHILEREIYKSGTFKDKLQDYAYAMARSENLDAKKMEGQIRDLFRERTGQTMNQLRETLKSREDNARAEDAQKMRDTVLYAAHEIEVQMMNGDKITFNRAAAEKAQTLAEDFGVTDNHARKMMIEAFESEQGDGGMSWKDWGEKLDETYYRPQIDAEKQARAEAKREVGPTSGLRRPSRRR